MVRGASMRVCMAVLAASVLFGRPALAAPPELPIAVAYDAPEGCPLQVDFEEELRSRIPARWIHEADPRRFEVHIERDRDGFAGRLLLHAPGRAPDVREIRAPECSEVGTAMAVFIAIALDPAAEDAPPPSRIAAPAARPKTPPPRRAPPWTWSSGLELVHLRMPAAAWGGRVHGELARTLSPRIIEPALGVSWGWSDFSVPVARAGETRFRLHDARLEGCARVLLPLFTIAPCAAFAIGVLEGTTPDLPSVGHATTRWTSADVLVRAGRALTPWLSVDVHAGVRVPLERTAFVAVDPDRYVYRPPPVVFELGLSARVTARFH